ncbi:DHA2 family efflux MFS transporter permease subunit [Luteolibacter pohnpeiensis]|uniref:DHA2 family efflux MFS transporter permease subunit n=1 Tax=Luteolibacter pohnpeiensis TaxID=454153 RepID=A0A934VWT2_9BACT|nr:DHA2 family efflux MFS transporter permease subunit [Luteolibacter pohnpeiensis]MBK1883610.1 DHA2 family efflux MFS transporter permease subunit [Luteolibacter pohnpeiensis]
MLEDEKVEFRKWLAVVGTMLGAFMAILDIQITNSSLRDIAGGISATTSEASWISTAYLIGEIVTIPLTAWLSRIFSVRIYLLVNIVLFLTFSALCGISTSLSEMIIFRAGQGFTGGVFIPMSLTVMLSILPRRLHPVGQAIFGLTATLAPAIGPALGGWLTGKFGWEWNFYINFVPGIIMFATVWFAIESKPMNLKGLIGGDWWGILCMAIGLGALVAMLEEGQREDWFGSEFIVTCGIIAGIFVPLFILIELIRKEPFVNLRLLGDRNVGMGSAVGFLLGLGLYGSIYLIPLYLGSVQQYSPLQIGETLIWVGLPQLLVFPILPKLMKRFDLRLLVCFGCILFASSCLMNAFMSYNYAEDQFIFSNVVRALGQPFTIVPVTAIAVASLAKKDAGDGSAIFNIMRNLGGSVGIAILSTIVTRREQFHDERIGESISLFDPATRQRLADSQQAFISKGSDPVTAMSQAMASLKNIVSREANIMAFNDAFYFVAISLFAAAVMIWVCRRTRGGAAPPAH